MNMLKNIIRYFTNREITGMVLIKQKNKVLFDYTIDKEELIGILYGLIDELDPVVIEDNGGDGYEKIMAELNKQDIEGRRN